MDCQPAQHAASLGQVPRAWLSGSRRPLAVKIQYPDIAQAVRNEMRLLGLLPRLGPVSTYAFDLNAYKRVLTENFECELDYLGEAQRQQRFRNEVQLAGLVVPEVLSELCSEKVRVQEYVPGLRLNHVQTMDQDLRDRVGSISLRTFFHGLFMSGLLHGDPHAGNYRFTHDGDVILYDFGCIVELRPQTRLVLLSLILTIKSGVTFDALGYFVQLGFNEEKLTPST